VTAAYAEDIAYSSVTGASPLKETVFRGNQNAYDVGLLFVSIISAGTFELASKSPGVCFVAGTKVSTENGLAAIETIKPGDMVWAEDSETGEKALKKVVQTFVNETDELVHLIVNDEEIITTPEHPFYVPQKGWTNANELHKGDTLVLQSGKYVTVENIRQEKLEEPITVYNFEVEDFHTYYVGESSVLVHNANCGNNNSFKKYTSSKLSKITSSAFHGEGAVKKAILKDVDPSILFRIGRNPDIYINKNGIIQLVSTVNKGVSVITDLNIKWY
jgi:hypothetical protein